MLKSSKKHDEIHLCAISKVIFTLTFEYNRFHHAFFRILTHRFLNLRFYDAFIFSSGSLNKKFFKSLRHLQIENYTSRHKNPFVALNDHDFRFQRFDHC